MVDYFEGNFQPYRSLLEQGRYADSIEAALHLLESYRTANPAAYPNEHKGSPFYVMGYAAFASHDYPSASLFFDAAVAEDIRRYGNAANKPALEFMQLEDTQQQPVLASQIIGVITAAVQRLIDSYNSKSGARQITMNELRTLFLRRVIVSPDEHKRTLVTAFISFVAEWSYRSRLIDIFDRGSREPFFLHLFRGCLLLESMLKEDPQNRVPPNTQLGNALQRLHTVLGIPANITTRATDFDAQVLLPLRPLSTVSTSDAIEFTAKARNTLGHTLVWASPSLDRQAYDHLVDTIATALLHTISTCIGNRRAVNTRESARNADL
jgi:hypothetical protein